MLRFKTHNDGRTTIGLGVSRGNIERLTAGMPIMVRGESVHMPTIDILIFFGETEQAMYEEMKSHGYIDSTTKIIKEQTQ